MLDEKYYARVAADPSLFAKMYHRVKEPDRALVAKTSPDIAAKKQQIHSTYEQLHYILARTGTARGLASQPGYQQPIGTEAKSVMTASTARSVQIDALARLIGLHAGEQVRMPGYTHRFGPMMHKSANPDEDAAKNMSAVLGSLDEGGANIRVTPADRGPGAYVSTDSDNFYGPHGVTFDPRDLHQLPLSESEDNQWEVSSERTKDQRHQFRAMGKPIALTEDSRPAYSSIFVGSSKQQTDRLTEQLKPPGFTPGVLQDETQALLRSALTAAAFRVARAARPEGVGKGEKPKIPLPERPPAIPVQGLKEKPISNEHAFMMQSMVQELNGLYEPHSWTKRWQENQRLKLMKGMSDALDRMYIPKREAKDDNTGAADDEWK